ncbi:hypothetical protein AMS68_000738 [Peltaster fructicola]|uniref:ZZ-type domain-containing protein n=1 Tax=Peltaster fructicola TaxID=286661 RepID=A0A6H0XKR4_9PEZI|nr:hypothetical protein AMS68_000738 [Peltaster fructicola]
MATNSASVTPDTLITIKVSLNDAVKKLKLPLKDLNATTLTDKLRACLNISADQTVVFERYSDSFGGFITLSPANTPVFKALVRAAKAKGKLRLKASIIPPVMAQEQKTTIDEMYANARAQSKQMDEESMMRNHRRGQGIFQYREARASEQTLVNDEAPVPKPFTAHNISPEIKQATLQACQELVFRTREKMATATASSTAWSVYCNICDAAMADVHYHCSICDGGDYDLCEKCVSDGNTCPGEDHWLIKRFIQNDRVIASTTERLCRKTPSAEIESTMPGAFTEEAKVLATEPAAEPSRTCNSCVVVLPEREFVTCGDCSDYDLCVQCHTGNVHGHHPGHTFLPATTNTILSASSQALLKAGRNVEHNAFCDGCDKKIFGVRHKCLQCPDWDYCNDCIKTAPTAHRGHRFAAIHEQLSEPQPNLVRHFGIYCDGPLCTKDAKQSYIQGARFKCAVCHDTDFCARCEALPGHHHNRTHPLIKFMMPVRNVNITTYNEDLHGNARTMGDKPAVRAEPAAQNAAIPVQTVAEITPTEEKSSRQRPQPFDGDVVSARTAAPVVPLLAPIAPSVVPTSMLNATFVRDSIADGTVVAPGSQFTQIWTLRNEGPHAWPAGCSVRYVGGDNMLNVDNGRPASVSSINEAIESSIVAREVQVGEEIAFRITLKAPLREGKSISYWRLKAADGTPFGHRLWCDIEVRSTKPIAPPLQNPPFVPAAKDATPYFPADYAAMRQHHSRLQAMRQHQLRLLHQQQMLGLAAPATPIEPVTEKSPFAQRPIVSEDERLRKESAKARMEAIRTRILQTRAENLKRLASMSNITKTSAQESTTPQESAVVPITKSPIEEQTAAAEPVSIPADEVRSEVLSDSTSSSQMIFPKLEKESPSSSIVASKGKAAYVENEDGEVEQSAVPQSPSTVAEPTIAQPLEDFDDIEVLSVSADSDDDEDDGFLTDEEYDILDASDRETVVSP